MKRVVAVVLMLMVSMFAAKHASALPVDYYPVADGQVTGTQVTTNGPYLMVGKSSAGYAPYRSALKFDLSSIPDNYSITSAVLNLYGPYSTVHGYSSTPFSFNLYYSPVDGWVEGDNSITSVTGQTTTASQLLASQTFTQNSTGWTQWDLLANGNWDPSVDLANNDNTLTLLMKGADETLTSTHYTFISKEPFLLWYDTSYIPRLTIDTAPIAAPVPEPASLSLLGLGLAGMLFRKKKITA